MGLATAVLCAAVVAVLAIGPEERTAAEGFQGAAAERIPPRDFRLTDEDGKPATLAQYAGRPFVLTFLYSTCEDTCPVTASQIRGALDDLGDDAPPALAISVDPANDTRLNAKRFLTEQRLTGGRMRFLLGSETQLEPIWKAYGIRPQGDGFDHSAYVLLVDHTGRQRVSFPFDKLTPEALASDLAKLQREAASVSSAASARSSAAK